MDSARQRKSSTTINEVDQVKSATIAGSIKFSME
jgi:hypothetical protein